MPFSTLLLSVATVGTTTLAFAIAAPASAQGTTRINTTRTSAIATTPTITRVVRSSFTRKNRRQCRARATPGAR